METIEMFREKDTNKDIEITLEEGYLDKIILPYEKVFIPTLCNKRRIRIGLELGKCLNKITLIIPANKGYRELVGEKKEKIKKKNETFIYKF